MKSGLEGRNNPGHEGDDQRGHRVSMKSGLEGRNNVAPQLSKAFSFVVSMKSGLEGRNNYATIRDCYFLKWESQ